MLEEARNADNTRLAERLQNELDYALKELDDKISGWYSRLADNNCVSMAQARKLLSRKELKEFYWTVDEYIEKGRENGIRHNWEKELENASARVHINKFEALKIELRGIAERLGISEENQLKEHLSAQYEDTYYHTAFELQDGFGVYQNTAKVNQKHLNTVLSKPWTADNKTFSDRIWEDKDALISEVTRQLTRNILLGRPRDDSIRAIAKRFETSKSNAARLVHTESAYISAEAARDTYDYLDVDRFEVDAALDSKTCSICGEMDGKVFETKDYQPGLTANPFHPNCRCTTVPYIDDDIQRELEEKTGRSMRNPETGKTEIVSRMTYKEWKAKYVDNSDKSGIIEVGSGDMYRKTKDKQVEPMPKKQLHKIEKSFKRQGRTIQRSDEIDKYLESKNAEAITYNQSIILLKKNPGRASVFEELIHATQYKNGENDGSYESRLKCEIAAQKKLIRNRKAYKLTQNEVKQTEQALIAYEDELNKFKQGGK